MSKAKHTQEQLRTVMQGFQVWGDFISGTPYGSGHINDTYQINMSVAGSNMHYLLQRINHAIFTAPDQVMENIVRVTTHQNRALQQSEHLDVSRRALTVIPSHEGLPYVRDSGSNWWRLYLFIEDALTHDVITSDNQAYEAARAFAQFQGVLADLPAPRLHETIPDFHNTVKRLATLDQAAKSDAFNRVAGAGPELEFIEARRASCARLLERHAAGEIPERITHNDTKINNVMLDNNTGEGVCVIDLDTVMPGLALYDFGDMVRTATAAAPEDEQDLSKVYSRINMFKALARGYLSDAHFLVPAEVEELVFSGRLITLTIGIRFLTDYLSGDTYFRTTRPGQNLDRCRTQLQMVRSMEEQEQAMEEIVRETYSS